MLHRLITCGNFVTIFTNAIMLLPENLIHQMNHYGVRKIPFLFILDFELKKPVIYPFKEIPSSILFKIGNQKNTTNVNNRINHEFTFENTPVSKKIYTKAFNQVQDHLQRGDTYLLNLTFPSKIETNLTLRQIFDYSESPYKLLIDSQFVCFSPESFIRIDHGQIASFPMKGTIDASTPNAQQVILNDPKEKAEHSTIVDLIRNDLNRVSEHVRVKRFRYIDRVKTRNGAILQVSSEITGQLNDEYAAHIGNIIDAVLPAGSITGAPKAKTVQIIEEAELTERGYYTGIFGYFDGVNMDSAVMIRCLQKDKSGQLYFHSGGGITAQSNLNSEYNELIQKVYVPFN